MGRHFIYEAKFCFSRYDFLRFAGMGGRAPSEVPPKGAFKHPGKVPGKFPESSRKVPGKFFRLLPEVPGKFTNVPGKYYF